MSKRDKQLKDNRIDGVNVMLTSICMYVFILYIVNIYSEVDQATINDLPKLGLRLHNQIQPK